MRLVASVQRQRAQVALTLPEREEISRAVVASSLVQRGRSPFIRGVAALHVAEDVTFLTW